jgi:hypothetical protein
VVYNYDPTLAWKKGLSCSRTLAVLERGPK